MKTKCSETEQIQTGNFSHVIGNDILPKILREQSLFTIFGKPVLLNDNFKSYMFVVIYSINPNTAGNHFDMANSDFRNNIILNIMIG